MGFLTQWARLSGLPGELLLILWILWNGFFWPFFIMLLRRSDVPIIKARSPRFLAISAIGGYILVTLATFQFLVTPPIFPCVISHWQTWLIYPVTDHHSSPSSDFHLPLISYPCSSGS